MPTALPVSANVDTFLQSANQAAMQTNLALVPGTNVQAYSATLAAVAGGTYTGASSITTLGTIATGVWNGTAIAVANGGTGATDSSTARTNLGLAIGTNVQAYNATLAAVAGGTYTGASSITTLGTVATGVWNGTTIAVANGGTGATDASTARTNLGLGTIATQAASAVAVTGGTITGLTNFGVSMANNTAITGISLGTITDTTSRPLAISQTWNNAGLTATLLKINATDTSSASGSLLAEFQNGGVKVASIAKNGFIWTGPNSNYYFASIRLAQFSDQYNTGFGSGGPDLIQVITHNGGGPIALFDGTIRKFTVGSDLSIGWASQTNVGNGGNPDVLLYRDETGTLAQKNGANAQKFRVYGNTTGSKYLQAEHDGTNAKLSASSGSLLISSLPTANPGPGILWNNGGTPAIGT